MSEYEVRECTSKKGWFECYKNGKWIDAFPDRDEAEAVVDLFEKANNLTKVVDVYE